jgi:hypothetical protein
LADGLMRPETIQMAVLWLGRKFGRSSYEQAGRLESRGVDR